MEIYFVRLARLSTPDPDTVTASTGSAGHAWTADLIIFVGLALETYGIGMIRWERKEVFVKFPSPHHILQFAAIVPRPTDARFVDLHRLSPFCGNGTLGVVACLP